MTIDRLMQVLDDWAKWMRRPSNKLGYPTRSAFLSTGGESTVSAFEEMISESDLKNVLKVDALISSLPKHQAEAINSRYLGSKQPSNYAHELEMAMDNLLMWADRRNIV
jgi:hypothetical protein